MLFRRYLSSVGHEWGVGVENISWEGEAIVIIQMQFALVVCRNEKLLSKLVMKKGGMN